MTVTLGNSLSLLKNGGDEMKIKQVCEKTKLTSRTVRLYIEEKLIFPEYSENYLGRKSFEFSDKDVKALLDIATLRRFGFAIAEIRKINEAKENSASIINDICKRKTKTIQDETEMLSILSKLNNGEYYTIEEISNELNSCHEEHDLPKDDTLSEFYSLLRNPKQLINRVYDIADKLLLITSLGVSVFFIIYYFTEWKYPYFTDVSKGLIYLFLTSLPAIIILSFFVYANIIVKKQLKIQQISGIGFAGIILVLFSLVPILIIGVIRPVGSFTTDMENYRKIDEYESKVCNNSFYNELFPIMPQGAVSENDKNYPDSDYYYRCIASFDFTIDIYAEWSLDEAEFYKEVDRVKRLYTAYEMLDSDEMNYLYNEQQKGEYTCLIRYDGSNPFAQEEDDYYYFIFAYDENNLRVRYILCYSGENGAEQPYYLQLDW